MIISIILVAFASCLYGYYFWKNYKLYRKECENLPPGTLGWPVIGETLQFAKKKIQYFKDRHDEYGRIYKTSLFGKQIIRVCGAENIRKITLGENKIVRSSYPQSVVKILSENTISMSQGEEHQRRKLELLKFLTPDYLNTHVPYMANMISARIQQWCDMPHISLYEECSKLFTELACNFLIKLDIQEDDITALRESLTVLNSNIFCLPFNVPGFGLYKALQAKKQLKQHITKVLNQPGMNNNDASQLPSILESLRSSHGDKIDPETEDQLLDAIVELMFMGSDTVTSAGFSLANSLIHHDHVMTKLQNEVEQMGSVNPTECLCEHDLRDMQYTQAVVKETLRLLPPVGGAYRTAIEQFELEGYTVPKGWSVVFSIRETQHRNDNCDSPLTFNPDRWLDPDFHFDKFSFAPFGAGSRMCPGQSYAKMVLKVFAVEFSKQCTAEILQDSELELWPTPRPSTPLLVRVRQR